MPKDLFGGATRPVQRKAARVLLFEREREEKEKGRKLNSEDFFLLSVSYRRTAGIS